MTDLQTVIYKGYVYRISNDGEFAYVQSTSLNGDPEKDTLFTLPVADFKGEDLTGPKKGSLVELRITPSGCEVSIDGKEKWTSEDLDFARTRAKNLSRYLGKGKE